jgi:hypothetical protein
MRIRTARRLVTGNENKIEIAGGPAFDVFESPLATCTKTAIRSVMRSTGDSPDARLMYDLTYLQLYRRVTENRGIRRGRGLGIL